MLHVQLWYNLAVKKISCQHFDAALSLLLQTDPNLIGEYGVKVSEENIEATSTRPKTPLFYSSTIGHKQ